MNYTGQKKRDGEKQKSGQIFWGNQQTGAK